MSNSMFSMEVTTVTKVYDTAGNYNWTVPANVHFVDILLAGGGGGGGGGGSGRNTAGGAGSNGTDGSAGGNTSFMSTFCRADGGAAGLYGHGAAANAQGAGSSTIDISTYRQPPYGSVSTTVGYPPTIGCVGSRGENGRAGAYNGNGNISDDTFIVATATAPIGSISRGGAGSNGGNSLNAGGIGGNGGAANENGGNGTVGVQGGGGGSGGGGNGDTYFGGGGGGGSGGGCEFITNYPVVPGTVVPLVVGAGGAGGTGGASSGAGSYAGGNGGNGGTGYIMIRYCPEVIIS